MSKGIENKNTDDRKSRLELAKLIGDDNQCISLMKQINNSQRNKVSDRDIRKLCEDLKTITKQPTIIRKNR